MLPLPEVERRTVPDLLDRARGFGLDRPFFLDLASGRSLTYGAFLEHVSGLAGELARRFRPGAVVAVLLPNQFEYVILRFALSCAGLVEAAINGEHKGPVLKGMLEVAAPAAIVCAERFRPNVEACGFARDGIAWIDDGALAELCRLEASWDARPRPPIEPGSACRIIYTSGTTSVSKGAELSHGYEVYTGFAYCSRMGLRAGDRWYYPTPFFHIDGLISIAALLHCGGSHALAPRFSASRFWQEVIASEATVMLYVGTILSIIQKLGDPPPGQRIRVGMGVGGTPALRQWFEERHKITLLEVYGLTECCGAAIDDWSARRPNSCGRPTLGYEIAILDGLDRPLPAGKRGQIAVRPREPFSMLSAYRNNPAATVASFRNLWFHTGDVGSFDEDGYLYFHGRMKDVIRHRDENISAEELEAVVDTHAAVLMSAAVAVPSDLGDEDILLYVLPKRGMAVEPAELCRYLAERVAPFMVPRHVRVVESLPLTPTEKVAKTGLSRAIDPSVWTRPSTRKASG
ncbi:MAG: AMP-binding protein [Alphaproteobacteria bacterium]